MIKDVPTLQQMLTFVYDKNGRPDAMSGKHDDLVIADCILNEISMQQDYKPSQEHISALTTADRFFGRKEEVTETLAGDIY